MNRDQLVLELRNSGVDVLAAMLAVPDSRLQAGVYEPGWNVRQLLAHLSAIEYAYRRLPDLAGRGDGGGGDGRAAGDFDAYNARQVDRRVGKSLDELIEEFVSGRGRLIAEASALDESVLSTRVTSSGGSAGTLAEVMTAVACGHSRAHADDLLQGVGTSPSVCHQTVAALRLAAEETAACCDVAPIGRWGSRSTADDWTAGNIAGHIAEIMPYWSEKTLEAIEQPGSVLGRDLTAPERLGAVIDGEALSPAEAAQAIRRAAVTASKALHRVPPAGWLAQIPTSRFGPLPARECLAILVISHTYEHLSQIRQALG